MPPSDDMMVSIWLQCCQRTVLPLHELSLEHLNDDLRVGALAEQVRMSRGTSRGPMQKSGAVLRQ
jgi:hypothetical protein